MKNIDLYILKEYVGTYAPDSRGHLQFIEGVLLKAVRDGDWIILDELNLAPSSVLEALNRVNYLSWFMYHRKNQF